MKKFITSILLLAGLATATSSCKKDDPTNTMPKTMNVSGNLTGANLVPAITVPGTGTVTGTYNPATYKLSYTITFSGLSGPATSGHFHISPPGTVNKTPTISFPNPVTSPIVGEVTLTPEQIDALLNGNIYANIHTDNNKGGEIRANVVAK